MQEKSRLAVVLTLSALFVAACGGGSDSDSGSTPGSSPASVERTISPTTIDAAANESVEPHVVINPSSAVAAANKLFVFLPGTAGKPEFYKLIVEAAARRGFHAIGLNYQTGLIPVGFTCLVQSDPNCFFNVRSEILTGEDRSATVSVSPPNSIVTRLTKAIDYLNRTYPTEGWGQYLTSAGAVDWSKVSVGGHSQGGGHAGLMTKLYSLNRACYFAAPPDWDTSTRAPASWMTLPNLTAASRQFGFGSPQDPSVPYNQLSLNWQALGLAAFGAAVSADNNTAFAGSHMLTTNATPAASNEVGEPLHGLTVRDAFTPRTAAGTAVFEAAWAYLCFE